MKLINLLKNSSSSISTSKGIMPYQLNSKDLSSSASKMNLNVIRSSQSIALARFSTFVRQKLSKFGQIIMEDIVVVLLKRRIRKMFS